MPKDKEKLQAKAKRRRKSDNNKATTTRQNQQRPRIINDDGIAVSRQLARKMKTNRNIGRPRKHVNNNNNEPRICGNGQPMPSLADLEKMFDDSDDDAEKCEVNISTNTTSINTNPVSCSTPKKTPMISEDKLKSPSTIKTIADKMLDFISNLPDATILLDEVPRPPVIPQRKRKKPDVPYIVGCKERAYVPSKPTTNFCKGDDDYGVNPNDVNSDDDDDCSKPRAKKSKVPNISKSIFNAKSDEIAARLKECESDGSSDSNKTVAYEYYAPNNSVQLRSFSPLPSTSKDSETIHKNDIRFNESLIVEQSPSEEKENDLEIINQPLDTIVIDNETGSKEVQSMPDTSLFVIDDSSPSHMVHNDKLTENVPLSIDDDSCIEIVEKKPKIDDSPIIVEDYYSSLDFSVPCHKDLTEVIDVDDVIAESNAIIQKYRKSNDLNSVTFVEPENNIDNPSESTEKYTSSVADNVEPVMSPGITPGVNEQHDTIINNTERHTLLTNYSPNMPSGAFPTGSNYVHDISDIAYMPSSPRQGSSVQFVSSTPLHNTSSVEYISTTLRANNPPVHNVPQNEDNIENVVRNFFNLNNNSDGQSNSALSQVNQQSSSCNSHNHTANAMCIFSFLQSMSNLTRNRNSGSKKKNKKNTRNIQPQVVTPPPPPLLQTESQAPQTSKALGDCPICMDSLATNPVASTICGHIFCMKCISAAVKSSGKRCPTCRKVLKGVGFHPLFL